MPSNYNTYVSNTEDTHKSIDFTKMDNAIRTLIDVLVINHKNNVTHVAEQQPIRQKKKKLNIEMIRSMLKEAQEIKAKNKHT